MSETHENQDRAPESFWEKQLREGKSQLESLWSEAQKAQHESLRRAKLTADELAQSLQTGYAQTSERVTRLAAEARVRGKELLARAQERWGTPGSRAAAPADDGAEPVPPVKPPSPPAARED